MATNDHSEGIRLQAESVVRAYNELRGTAKNSDFTSDEFPVGKLVEVFQQIRQLEGWLEPAPSASEEQHESR